MKIDHTVLRTIKAKLPEPKGVRSTRMSQYAQPIILLLAAFILSCARIPPHMGKSRDVIVISSEIDSSAIVNNLQVYNYVPQREALFSFIFAADTAIKQYNRYHTLILYGSLQDEFIDIILDPDAKETTRTDTFTLFKLNNVWAKEQLVIILAASKIEYIQQGMKKYQNLISKILEENYYAKIKANHYSRALDKKVKNTLRKFGITFDVGKGWLIDSTFTNDNFVFVHAHFPDRSIFFYTERLDKQLTSSFVLDKRDSLTEKYYNGDYILRDLTYSEKIEFKDMTGLRLKGVWQNDSLVAGGPFISYFLTKNDTLYVIDGMLFNPGERKSDYFTVLEVILNSFELRSNKNS
jgi:hypothetical protein